MSGVTYTIYDGNLGKIRNEIKVANPVIVLWDSGKYDFIDANEIFPRTICNYQKIWDFSEVVKKLK